MGTNPYNGYEVSVVRAKSGKWAVIVRDAKGQRVGEPTFFLDRDKAAKDAEKLGEWFQIPVNV